MDLISWFVLVYGVGLYLVLVRRPERIENTALFRMAWFGYCAALGCFAIQSLMALAITTPGSTLAVRQSLEAVAVLGGLSWAALAASVLCFQGAMFGSLLEPRKATLTTARKRRPIKKPAGDGSDPEQAASDDQ